MQVMFYVFLKKIFLLIKLPIHFFIYRNTTCIVKYVFIFMYTICVYMLAGVKEMHLVFMMCNLH